MAIQTSHNIETFHSCLNPDNEKLYIPCGRPNQIMAAITIEEKKKMFKRARTTWKNLTGRFTADEISAYMDKQVRDDSPMVLGFQVPDDLIVVDVDLVEAAEILTFMLDTLNIKHCRLKTSAGKHFIFKKPEKTTRRLLSTATPIGILVDQLTSRDSYIILPFMPNHIPCMRDNYSNLFTDRGVEKLIPKSELDLIPEWLIANKSLGIGKCFKPKDKSKYQVAREMQDNILPIPLSSGTKTDNLQRWLHNLSYRGYDKDSIEMYIRLINEYICSPSIPINTLEAEILNKRNVENAVKNSERAHEMAAIFEEDGKFTHYGFAQHMVTKYNIISLEGKLAIYNEGVYELNEDVVRQKMLQEIPILTKKMVEETVYHLQKLHYSYYQDNAHPYEIVLNNGVMDLTTGLLQPFDPKKINLNKLHIDYADFSSLMGLPPEQKPDYMNTVENFLVELTKANKGAQPDFDLIQLILEMCGYTLWKKSPLKKAFILKGDGDNGKSRLLEMLQTILGMKNYTTLEFNEFTNDNFKVANLKNKLACISNDISKHKIKETNLFKAVVSGDPIEAGAKSVQAKGFIPYSTVIMSANEVPKSDDSSKGFLERVYIIPLERDFVQEGIADPDLKVKLTSVGALQYFLYLIIRAGKGLYDKMLDVNVPINEKFHNSDRSRLASLTYKLEHSSVMRWLLIEKIPVEYFEGKKRKETLDTYMDYCRNEGNHVLPVGRNVFYTTVMKHYTILKKKRTSIAEIWYT